VAPSSGWKNIIMSYYPLLKGPGLSGWTTLCNFSPNNWEISGSKEQFINVTWASGGMWFSKTIGVLDSGALRTVQANELNHFVPYESLALLSLTSTQLPSESSTLPKLNSKQSTVPAWRATLGLASSSTQTSYQGELDPFPPQGSLLTFAPFLQFGKGISNYLILLNIENSPVSRFSELQVYDASETKLYGSFSIQNNACTCIPLDSLDFGVSDLPIFICRGMAAIPLYLSTMNGGTYLSLEHTHPPASLVIHGRRWEAQKILKSCWFAKTLR
jgi:hypothetical protein